MPQNYQQTRCWIRSSFFDFW